MRERTKLTTESLGGRNCAGNPREERECKIIDCPGEYIIITIINIIISEQLSHISAIKLYIQYLFNHSKQGMRHQL